MSGGAADVTNFEQSGLTLNKSKFIAAMIQVITNASQTCSLELTVPNG